MIRMSWALRVIVGASNVEGGGTPDGVCSASRVTRLAHRGLFLSLDIS